MLKVYQDGSIELTRGDTAHLDVTISNDVTGEAYVMQPGDVLVLSVKKDISDTEPCLQKSIEGQSTFHIKPEDTRGLSYGKYKYDVQLTTEDADVYTVLGPATLELLTEVTC